MTDAIKFFRINDEGLRTPVRGTTGSAGFDLSAVSECTIQPGQQQLILTGVGFEIPEGFFGMIAPRSGLSKRGIVCTLGIIDSDYRGDVGIILRNVTDLPIVIDKDSRIAQIIFIPCFMGSLIEVEPSAASSTTRGLNGFGSTGM